MRGGMCSSVTGGKAQYMHLGSSLRISSRFLLLLLASLNGWFSPDGSLVESRHPTYLTGLSTIASYLCDPNKFRVALLVLSLLGPGTTYRVASGDLTPNVFDLFGNLLVATIFGMVR